MKKYVIDKENANKFSLKEIIIGKYGKLKRTVLTGTLLVSVFNSGLVGVEALAAVKPADEFYNNFSEYRVVSELDMNESEKEKYLSQMEKDIDQMFMLYNTMHNANLTEEVQSLEEKSTVVDEAIYGEKNVSNAIGDQINALDTGHEEHQERQEESRRLSEKRLLSEKKMDYNNEMIDRIEQEKTLNSLAEKQYYEDQNIKVILQEKKVVLEDKLEKIQKNASALKENLNEIDALEKEVEMDQESRHGLEEKQMTAEGYIEQNNIVTENVELKKDFVPDNEIGQNTYQGLSEKQMVAEKQNVVVHEQVIENVEQELNKMDQREQTNNLNQESKPGLEEKQVLIFNDITGIENDLNSINDQINAIDERTEQYQNNQPMNNRLNEKQTLYEKENFELKQNINAIDERQKQIEEENKQYEANQESKRKLQEKQAESKERILIHTNNKLKIQERMSKLLNHMSKIANTAVNNYQNEQTNVR